jgi:transmembrane protein 196
MSLVTLMVDCVNIQLLRLGLVNITTDGQAYLKERKDFLVSLTLMVSVIECLMCLLSLSVGLRLSYDAANRKFRKKEGAFFVQILSEKDIVVVSKPPSSKPSGSVHESSPSFDRSSN